jgi:protease-4
LATIIGLFIFFMLFFWNTNCRGSFWWWFRTITVKNNSVIVLNLEDKWLRRKIWTGSLFLQIKKSVGLTDVIKAIEDAENRWWYKGISILNNNLGMAQSKALRMNLSFKNQEICNGLCQFLYTRKNTTSRC